MSKPVIALLTLGATILVVVAVIIGLAIWAFSLSAVARSSRLSDEEQINENIVIVEDSIEWKLISLQNDDRGNEARVSFKFTVRNPTNEDILIDVYQLRILFLDSEGFALDRYNWSDDFTVPANGEYTYTRPHDLRGGLGEQVAFIEVLGVRSKH